MDVLHRTRPRWPRPAAGGRTAARRHDRTRADVPGQLRPVFPAQDLLPAKTSGNGSFGNLIALPLTGACRERGTTLFCHPATWTPHPDQFAHLSQIQRLSRGKVEALVDTLQPVVVRARLGAMLAIAAQDLPAPLLAVLKHLASLHNPDFYKKQEMRYSTFGTPRFVMCFDASDTDWLRIPRGLESMYHHRRRVLARHGFTTRTATEPSATQVSTPQDDTSPIQNPHSEKSTVAEVRAWARDNGHAVPNRGRLRADIWTAWHAVHPT